MIVGVVVFLLYQLYRGHDSKSTDAGGGAPVNPGPVNAGPQISYKTLTCDQWLHTYGPADRLSAAEDFVVALKAYDQSAQYAQSFAHDISKACRAAPGTEGAAEIAAAIATIATADFPR